MLVCGIDTETTGLDPEKDGIIEVGAVLFEVTDGNWKPVQQYDSLVYEHSYPALSEKIKELTHITSLENGIPFQVALAALSDLASQADMLISHHRDFDKAMILKNMERFKMSLPVFTDKPWLCSIKDLELAKGRRCRVLSHMALDFGVFVDPTLLHRASGDVTVMGQMLSHMKVDPRAMLAYQKLPEIVVEIETPAPWTDGGTGVSVAKSNGFSWEKLDDPKVKVDKTWIKRIKEVDIEEMKQNCAPYPVLLNRRLP